MQIRRTRAAGIPRGRSRGGSVLLPVVAAMLLLALTGMALGELIAAQGHQSVIGVETQKAYWIAEAGAWHAAREGTGLPTPVPHAGGSYTVVKSGGVYTSTGTFGAARRIVVRELAGTGGAAGVLDVLASQASARAASRRRFELDLVSLSPTDLVLASFALSSSSAPEEVRELRLAGRRIWRDNNVFTPTGTTPLNDGSTADRTVPAGSSPTLRVDFQDNQSGSITYGLVLDFTDGSSASLSFTIDW